MIMYVVVVFSGLHGFFATLLYTRIFLGLFDLNQSLLITPSQVFYQALNDWKGYKSTQLEI